MVLDEVVAKILSSRLPVHNELVLLDAIADPVEPYVHGVGLALFECVVGNTKSGGVVSFDGGGWLGVTKSNESGA
jgi:hypothetical protein